MGSSKDSYRFLLEGVSSHSSTISRSSYRHEASGVSVAGPVKKAESSSDEG